MSSQTSRPFWLSAFLDLPEDAFSDAVTFWTAVTGFTMSPLRGESDQFGTLIPPAGDDYLRVQRTGSPARIHLDVHVPDPDAGAERATAFGAEELADPGLGYRTMRSPGGLVFCLVSHPCGARPPARQWPGGHRSRVDQVALDLPVEVHAVESDFWATLLDAAAEPTDAEEFSVIDRRPELPLRVLLHRLEEPTGTARAHLDLASDDRDAEVARHRGLGAEFVRRHEGWTVLRDPAGLLYCVTVRDPAQ